MDRVNRVDTRTDGGIGSLLVRLVTVVRLVRLARTQRKKGQTHTQTDILF